MDVYSVFWFDYYSQQGSMVVVTTFCWDSFVGVCVWHSGKSVCFDSKNGILWHFFQYTMWYVQMTENPKLSLFISMNTDLVKQCDSVSNNKAVVWAKQCCHHQSYLFWPTFTCTRLHAGYNINKVNRHVHTETKVLQNQISYTVISIACQFC